MDNANAEHAWFREQIAVFVAGGLTPTELARFGAHRADCAECAAELEKVLTVDRAMKAAFANAAPAAGFEDRLIGAVRGEAARAKVVRFSPFLRRVAALCAATVLIGVALYVVAKAPQGDAHKVAEMTPPPNHPRPEPKHPPATLDQIINEGPNTPVDPNSKESSDIVVPPEIIAKAELGDHFETINPDRPETHSALGNTESKSFHSVEGEAEPASGGGANGLGAEDLIGVGGTASKGTGGGFGGGNGTGAGVDSGSGQGSFGARNGGGRRLMVKRHGGSAATENAVEKALQWLAAHQEPDGHWDAKKYGAVDNSQDTSVTALALLAMLGAGHSEKIGAYKENVRHAVAWLSSDLVAQPRKHDQLPDIMGTLALSEASGMAHVKDTVATAQKLLDIYASEKSPDGTAWYGNATSEADFTLAGWHVMMLKSAKAAGLKVDPRSFQLAIEFLDNAEHKDPAAPASSYGFSEPGKKPTFTPRTCAIGNLARALLGFRTADLKDSVELFIQQFGTPADNDDGKKIDFDYWYFGTLCAFQHGGDIWKKWNEDLKKVLVLTQITTGEDDIGSWAPTGFNAQTRGRAGQTALGALCLETYYRYTRLQP